MVYEFDEPLEVAYRYRTVRVAVRTQSWHSSSLHSLVELFTLDFDFLYPYCSEPVAENPS